jgi:hypothetical protein
MVFYGSTGKVCFDHGLRVCSMALEVAKRLLLWVSAVPARNGPTWLLYSNDYLRYCIAALSKVRLLNLAGMDGLMDEVDVAHDVRRFFSRTFRSQLPRT